MDPIVLFEVFFVGAPIGALVLNNLIGSIKEVLIARSPAGLESARQAGITEQVEAIADMPTSNQPQALAMLESLHGPDADELLRRASVRENHHSSLTERLQELQAEAQQHQAMADALSAQIDAMMGKGWLDATEPLTEAQIASVVGEVSS